MAATARRQLRRCLTHSSLEKVCDYSKMMEVTEILIRTSISTTRSYLSLLQCCSDVSTNYRQAQMATLKTALAQLRKKGSAPMTETRAGLRQDLLLASITVRLFFILYHHRLRLRGGVWHARSGLPLLEPGFVVGPQRHCYFPLRFFIVTS